MASTRIRNSGGSAAWRSVQVLRVLCLCVLLLVSLGPCQAQNDTTSTNTSNGSTLPPVESPLVVNASTPSPSTTPTVGVPVVLPPTTSYFSITALFLMAFHLESLDENAGLMNDTQVLLFQTHMESSTQLFAATEEWQKVVTMCAVQRQDIVNSTIPPFTGIPTNDTPPSLLLLSDTNDTASTPTIPQQYNYHYAYQMTYLSTTVNVSEFPSRLEEYSMQNLDTLTQELQYLLDLLPLNKLQITSVEEVMEVTQSPTVANANPTVAPSTSSEPSMPPSISAAPTVSPQPSNLPSISPTLLPSQSPSNQPTIYPTYTLNISQVANYAMEITMQAPEGAGYLNTSQEDEFCDQMINQTDYLDAPEEEATRVKTQCVFFEDTFVRTVEAVPIPTPTPTIAPQPSLAPTTNRRRWLSFLKRPQRQRQLQDTYLKVVYTYTYTFRMRYTSDSVNVTDTGYTELFKNHIAFDTEFQEFFNAWFTDLVGLYAINNVTLSSINTYETKSAAPSYSQMPSASPTANPTVRETPLPSYRPTLPPVDQPPPSILPSVQPSTMPSMAPTMSPPKDDQTTLIVVVTVVAVVATALLAGMAWFYRTRRQSKLQQEAAHSSMRSRRTTSGDSLPLARRGSRKANPSSLNGQHLMQQQAHNTVATSPNSYYVANDLHDNHYPNNPASHHLVMSPSTSESILSNPSLLSNGQDEDGDDEDDDEQDVDDLMRQRHAKLSPLDDFDRFKDQNLEKLRSSVEMSVRGMDGMMSQALTHAILGGSVTESFDGNDGIEMEANALFEVTDWMKKHPSATHDERQLFMQEMLNKMVIGVRQGMMGPDDASRIIHECAALLNLQLKHDIVPDTVILNGMRKTVRANDVIRTFRKFGPIEDAAVAANQRGFGLVRFRDLKTVDQVMQRFRTSEIVVQDVAVQCRVLEPDR